MGPLVRWEPITQVGRLREEMNRVLQDFFGEGVEERPLTDGYRIPSVDVIDHGNDILVRAEIPGVDKDNLKIEVTPDSLLLCAGVKKEREEQEANYVRHERRVSTYQRVMPLPVEVLPSEVKATYHDGVLEVTLPKSEQAKTKQSVKVTIQ